MSIKQEIIATLDRVLKELDITEAKLHLEIPEDYKHGDYSSNIAMVVAKKLKKNPIEIADAIASHNIWQTAYAKWLEKVEVLRPGFINFWISQEFLSNNINDLLDNKNVYASIKTTSPRFEIYENTQPNTNKPLHIGHLRNIALGSSIVSLRKTLGHKVWSVNINNDRGIHIVKGMWGYLAFGKNLKSRISNLKFEKPEMSWRALLKDWVENSRKWETPESTETKADYFIGQYYVLGDKAEKEQRGETVTLQFKEMLKVWEDGDEAVRKLWKRMNGWFYQGFRETHARFMGIDPAQGQFDKEWFESDIYKQGKQIVTQNLDKGVFVKREDGAVIASLKKYALPDKVVIRSDGTSIYITQDIELAKIRVQEEKADFTAYIVGNEQDLHFKQLFAICQELGIGRSDQFLHISYGMVNLTGGVKMSSREGTSVSADELMDTIAKKIDEQFEVADKKVLEGIAIGAIKYWMLKYNHKAAIAFDIAESVSIHGNSGPYLQYTYARTQSVISKAGPAFAKASAGKPASSSAPRPSKLEERSGAGSPPLASPANLFPEEVLLLRLLYRFSDAVEEAAVKFSPNLLCNYLFELSSQFNLFYQKHQVLKSEQQDFRLGLTESVGIVIKEGLRLLGIAASEKM